MIGFFGFNNMSLLHLLKLMDDYVQRTENKTLPEKLEELKDEKA